ncbi:MAG TPA: thiamine-phosphate kinase [Gemmatales bacterium]|nr:thiamine-phosphate kinase [Gemmatales bacterium]
MAERDYIRWIRTQIASDRRVTIPPGDDCAGIAWSPGKELLVTTDMLLEGSCFLREAGPVRIGRKAMSVNLSDMAAMAGKPVAAVVSVGLPRDLPESWAQELFASLHAQAAAFETAIVGGDTNSWNGPLTINVTLFGEPTGGGPVRRGGAKPGDALLVTGTLGGSILGHHLDFTPRVKEAQQLHALAELHAMIDLSDGLSTDLHHLCEESGCGAEVWAEAVPVSLAAQQMQPPRSPLEHALCDGEDFELLFAVSAEDAARLLKSQPLATLGVNLTQIGCFLKEQGVYLKAGSTRQRLLSQGYEHQFGV